MDLRIRPEQVKRHRPPCLGCLDKPAKHRSHFCTQKCAALWAEELNQSTAWCPQCKEWQDTTRSGLCDCGDVAIFVTE